MNLDNNLNVQISWKSVMFTPKTNIIMLETSQLFWITLDHPIQIPVARDMAILVLPMGSGQNLLWAESISVFRTNRLTRVIGAHVLL